MLSLFINVFVCFADPVQSEALGKGKAISLVYSSKSLSLLGGMQAHSTQFYHLDVVAPSVAHSVLSVGSNLLGSRWAGLYLLCGA